MIAPTIHARVDRDGRLLSAEGRFDALNRSAGGGVGAAIAVPQVAALVRLALSLGVLVSRGITAADGDRDVEMWVRAEPQGDELALSFDGWHDQPAWRPPVDDAPADFLRASADFIWETDATLRLTALSGRGLSPERRMLLGGPLTALFALEADDNGTMPMLAAAATHQSFNDQRATLRTAESPVRLAAVARHDVAGRFAGFFGAAYVDEAVAEPAPEPATDGFGARLDRALRAPLGRIIANADSISAQTEGPLRRDYVDYAADIAHAGRHLLGLVDDLADLQAIERPDFTVAHEPVDLADVARRAAGLLGVRAADQQVRIDRPGVDDSLPATGEFRRALQVLVNLIGNAVRYSPPGSNVWIRLEREGDLAAVVIADQGKGIAPEDHHRIFEKFARVDNNEPGGSGLGLYIARRLARAMGGDINVDSAPGQGARFVFTLPAAE